MDIKQYGNTISLDTVSHIDKYIDCLNIDFRNGKIIGKGTRTDKDGYLQVNLKGKNIRVHHIIGFMMFGYRMVGKVINHIDLNKANNNPHNLELLTNQENVIHALRSGARHNKKGLAHPMSKFTAEDIVNIKKLLSEGKTLKEVGDLYGVAFQTISKIKNGKRYSEVESEFDEIIATMDFDKYQDSCARTTNRYSSEGDKLMEYCLGLAGESSEIIEAFKKYIFHNHEVDLDHIKEEIGDTLWYLTNLCSLIGVSLKDVAVYNVDKLKKRYPGGFDSNRSINREV